MASLLQFDHTPTLSLETQLEMLSLESNVLVNVIDTFRNIIPGLTQKLSDTLSSFKETKESHSTEEVKQLKKEYVAIVKKTSYANFVNYAKTMVSVPEGFKGNFLDYTRLLNKIAPEVFNEANKILGEYNFALSTFITNKENKVSIKDHTDVFHRVQKRRDELTKEINHFFKENSTNSKSYLGTVLNRFADLEDLVEEISKLESRLTASNLKEIASSVDKSVELLSIILKDAQEDGLSQVSGNAAMNISTGAYELGKFVEFISIFRFRTQQMIAAVSKLIQQLDEML